VASKSFQESFPEYREFLETKKASRELLIFQNSPKKLSENTLRM
jgi:hypothetical protein